MNVSKHNEDEKNDDGISMYLSFDTTTNSDSTSTYQTIACDDDLTSLSDLIDTDDSKGNTTLHNTKNKDELSGTMKDCVSIATDSISIQKHLHNAMKEDIMQDCISVGTHQNDLVKKPLVFPHVLREFNAISSTPSKPASTSNKKYYSPAKNLFEKSRSSLERNSANLCNVFNNLVTEYEQANKENPHPTSSDDSMPSFSKSSILQLQKLNNPSQQTSAKHECSQNKAKSIESVPDSIKVYNVSPPDKHRLSPQKTASLDLIKDSKMSPVLKLSPNKANIESVLETLKEHKVCLPTLSPKQLKSSPHKDSIEMIMESLKKCNIVPPANLQLNRKKASVENTLKTIDEHTRPTTNVFKGKGNKKVKMNSAVRKTICEPNLQLNRPSRIVSNKNIRFSMAMTNEPNIGDAAMRQGTAPPLRRPSASSLSLSSDTFMSTNPKKFKTRNESEDEIKPALLARKSASYVKVNDNGRKSIFINLQNEERPKQKRMPPIVKTTLNSATRRSIIPNASGTAIARRRSVMLMQSKTLQSPRNKRKKSLSSENSSNDIYEGPVKPNLNVRKSLYIEKPDAVKFACSECGSTYHVKSLLEAHKKTHCRAESTSPDLSRKPQRCVGGGLPNYGSTVSNAVNHQCKYCDRNFMLERTLHIHLMQHCEKIPAAERRKLKFTEMDHVKKEETPHFRMPQTRTLYKSNGVFSKDPLSNLPIGKSAELTKIRKNAKATVVGGGGKKNYEMAFNAQNISPSRQAANNKTQMAPPNSTKFKKRSAHTGVYRTPNKDIPCVSCKQSFKSVLDYTNHMMATHATLDASINSLGGHVE